MTSFSQDYVPSEPVTKVNLLQPLRNKTANTEPDAVTSSRIIQIEFVPENQGDGHCLEGFVAECQSMDMTQEMKFDASQIVMNLMILMVIKQVC